MKLRNPVNELGYCIDCVNHMTCDIPDTLPDGYVHRDIPIDCDEYEHLEMVKHEPKVIEIPVVILDDMSVREREDMVAHSLIVYGD